MEHGKVNPNVKWTLWITLAFLIIIVLGMAFLFGGSHSYADRPTEDERIQLLVPQFEKSVVNIDTAIAKGTGFYITKNMILTNWHVVSMESSILQFKHDGVTCKGTVGYRDEKWDLAILETSCEGVPLNLSKTNPKVGTSVFTVGFPKVFGYSLSKGAVSGEWNMFTMVDINVNTGNSGGPLVGLSGDVLGVITGMAKDAQGIGAAVPIEDVQRFIERAGVSVQ